ncbi:hypothetical protein ONS96_008101 [Cadophora gregata f. sp. sojae]|nr:hypothetical protein ONS96_008101 [Cadophora gregata f. sp. sojae]
MDDQLDQRGVEDIAAQPRYVYGQRNQCHHEVMVTELENPPRSVQSSQSNLSFVEYPKSEAAPCKVCADLSTTGSAGLGSTRASEEELHAAGERGCPTCSLISKATRSFCSSICNRESKTSNLLKVDGVTILNDGGHLSALLAIHQHDGVPLEVTLDLFSPRISTEFPVFKAPNCISSKLCLSDLVAKIAAWIQNCESKHIHCRLPEASILPSRVIDFGVLESFDDIKLVLGHGISAQYLALSYCWGAGTTMIQSTSSSLARWTEGIPWQQLPKTFQDAITLTRKLGIQYLWIDAVCIVQDDTQDWEFESANMANIYSNSYITIAATSASDSHRGLFTDRWTRSWGNNSIKIPVDAHHVATSANDHKDEIFVRPRLHLAHNRFCNMENAMDHTEDAPLLTRAWAFQERLLPSRTLHFHAEELIWECKSAVQCECQSLDRTFSFEQTGMEGWLKNFVTGSLHANHSVDELGHVWLDLVSEFGALRLTHEKDRLPALSGMASKFSDKCLGNYVAGIWEHDMARGLLFITSPLDNSQSAPTALPSSPSVPSWSWASVYLRGSMISYGHILAGGFVQDASFQVLIMDVKRSGNNPFSWVEHGSLRVKGRCSLTRIFTERSVSGHLRNKKFVIKIDGDHRVVPLEYFSSDDDLDSLDDTPLYCLLVGFQDSTWSVGQNPEGAQYEYVLVLYKVSEEQNTYRRVGLLSIMDDTCSLREQPVLTATLV